MKHITYDTICSKNGLVFSDIAEVGDTVERAMIEYLANTSSYKSMLDGYFQDGAVYAWAFHKDTRLVAPTYLTFEFGEEKNEWVFIGACFAYGHENVSFRSETNQKFVQLSR